MATWKVKNVRDERADGEGKRILVDRLWPRGVSKDAAALDDWAKDVAPSADLRNWFHHGAGQDDFAGFRSRYQAELDDNDAAQTFRAEHHGTVTLLTATADRAHNHALVLRDWLRDG